MKDPVCTKVGAVMIEGILQAMTLQELAQHYLSILRTRKRHLCYVMNGTTFCMARTNAKVLSEKVMREMADAQAKRDPNIAFAWPKISRVHTHPKRDDAYAELRRDATPAEAARYFASVTVYRPKTAKAA